MDFLSARRSTCGEEILVAVVRTFFEALARGKAATARRYVKEDFRWFGVRVAEEDWASKLAPAIASTPMHVQRVWPVMKNHLTLAPFELSIEFFDGPLHDDDGVALVNIHVNGRVVTAATVVDLRQTRTPRIRRVFEPTAYVEFIRTRAQK